MGFALPTTLTEHTSGVNTVLFSFDNKTLFSSSDGQTIKIWDISNGKCLKSLHGHTSRINSLAIFNDTILVSGSSDRTIRLWDTRTGECLKILQGHTNSVVSVAIHSDSKILASGSFDETIKL